MTVVLSILLAAVVGGVIFMLLDKWQRDAAAPAPGPELGRRSEPASGSLFATALSAPPPARTWEPIEPLRPARSDAQTEPLTPRHLWDDPSRRNHDDEDEPPRGLWSGWAR